MREIAASLIAIALLLIGAVILAVAVSTLPVRGQQFIPKSQMPFPDAMGLAIDDSCPHEGDETEAAHIAQNLVKNSFCAVGAPAANTPIRIGCY